MKKPLIKASTKTQDKRLHPNRKRRGQEHCNLSSPQNQDERKTKDEADDKLQQSRGIFK